MTSEKERGRTTKRMEVVYEGRPVAWERAAKGKTTESQREARRALRNALMYAPGAVAFEGPVEVDIVFDYVTNQTYIVFSEADETIYGRAWKKGVGKFMRPDIDNLEKHVLEVAQEAGIVKDDVQFVKVTKVKIG